MSTNFPPLLPQTGEARLRELARLGAQADHYNELGITQMLKGHRDRMDTCPHPDCVLVRSAGSAQAPETPPGKDKDA